MLYSKSIKEAEVKELLNIISKINPVEIVTPTNVSEVKEKWIESARDYYIFNHPFFEYDKNTLKAIAENSYKLEWIKDNFINGIKPENAEDQFILDLLIKRINQAILATEIAASIYLEDPRKTANLTQDIYGAPTSVQTIRCYDIAHGYKPADTAKSCLKQSERRRLQAMKYDAEEISYYFEKTLEYYGIEGWSIDIGKQYTSIDVRTRNSSGIPTVCIPEDRTVNGVKLLELIGHEIESHLRSVENARNLFAQLLGPDSPLLPLAIVLAKSDNELLDEGQAKLSDVHINGTEAIPTPYYTIAIDQARRGALFGDVANTIFGLRIKNGESIVSASKMSWINTYRVFRGCTNTRANGEYKYAFAKDYLYFAGYEIAKKTNPKYLQFASMEIPEIRYLDSLGLLGEARYENQNAVERIKALLLSRE